VVDRKKIIDGTKMKDWRPRNRPALDRPSQQRYSLARKIIFDLMELKMADRPEGLGQEVGAALLSPTKIYVKSVLALRKEVDILGMAHITGGGFTDNIPRVLPKGVRP
jgi:phosphoribosylformylglycinamidine cyclo-ligase